MLFLIITASIAVVSQAAFTTVSYIVLKKHKIIYAKFCDDVLRFRSRQGVPKSIDKFLEALLYIPTSSEAVRHNIFDRKRSRNIPTDRFAEAILKDVESLGEEAAKEFITILLTFSHVLITAHPIWGRWYALRLLRISRPTRARIALETAISINPKEIDIYRETLAA